MPRFFFLCLFSLLVIAAEKLERESRGVGPGRKELEKSAAVSTDEDRPSEAERTGASINTRR